MALDGVDSRVGKNLASYVSVLGNHNTPYHEVPNNLTSNSGKPPERVELLSCTHNRPREFL